MNIAQILRSSLPVVLVHLTAISQTQASDSLPSIDSIYSSGRSTRKEGISTIQPPVKAAPEVIRPLPPVIRPVAAKPTPAVRKNAPAPIKPAPVVVVPPVAKPVAAKPQPKREIVAEKVTPKPSPVVVKTEPVKKPAVVKSAPAAPKAPAIAKAPVVETPRKMAEYGPIISETLPVIGAAPQDEPSSPFVNVTKPKIAVEAKTKASKPKVASPDSLNNPAVARQIDPSKFSIFGPQSSSFRYDPRMIRAMEIASARAYGRSQGTCWRYVKNALLSAGLVDSRPTTAYAKEAAYELTTKYGFRKISCSNPYEAPLGSVLVYGGAGAGHVEFRTRGGFVSDFTTPRPSKRPLIGVYVK